MLPMTPFEIKDAIAEGEITAICLDTSIFGNPNEMSMEHGVLRHMGQFKDSTIDVVMPDVISLELLAHLEKGATTSLSELASALKKVGGSWNVSRELRNEATVKLLGGESPKDQAQRRFNSFVERTGCQIIKAEDHVKTSDVITRYFSAQPPFSTNEVKKHEFPDAYALFTLESWARENATKVLVVSNDGDWVSFCKGTDNLIVINQLPAALGYFQRNASVAANLLRDFYQKGKSQTLIEEVARAIQNHVDYMSFDAYCESAFHYDADIQDITVVEFSFDDEDEIFNPIDSGDDFLATETTVTVTLEASCDFSFTIRDGVDKDYVPIGGVSILKESNLTLPLVISFGGDFGKTPEILEVEITGNRHTIDFGYVAPDYGPDSDEV